MTLLPGLSSGALLLPSRPPSPPSPTPLLSPPSFPPTHVGLPATLLRSRRALRRGRPPRHHLHRRARHGGGPSRCRYSHRYSRRYARRYSHVPVGAEGAGRRGRHGHADAGALAACCAVLGCAVPCCAVLCRESADAGALVVSSGSVLCPDGLCWAVPCCVVGSQVQVCRRFAGPCCATLQGCPLGLPPAAPAVPCVPPTLSGLPGLQAHYPRLPRSKSPT
jgi:hypothetical protein